MVKTESSVCRELIFLRSKEEKLMFLLIECLYCMNLQVKCLLLSFFLYLFVLT